MGRVRFENRESHDQSDAINLQRVTLQVLGKRHMYRNRGTCIHKVAALTDGEAAVAIRARSMEAVETEEGGPQFVNENIDLLFNEAERINGGFQIRRRVCVGRRR
jgi:hypothetical protein